MPPVDDNREGVQIDLYGVKLKVTPDATPQGEPHSWLEVARAINKDLIAIVSNTFSLVADTLRAARSLVRGIGAIPPAMAARIEQSHSKADAAEDEAAAAHAERARELAIAEIERILKRKRVQGVTAELLFEKTKERVVVCILPPATEDEIRRIATTGIALSLPEHETTTESATGQDKREALERLKKRKRRFRRRKKKTPVSP